MSDGKARKLSNRSGIGLSEWAGSHWAGPHRSHWTDEGGRQARSEQPLRRAECQDYGGVGEGLPSARSGH